MVRKREAYTESTPRRRPVAEENWRLSNNEQFAVQNKFDEDFPDQQTPCWIAEVWRRMKNRRSTLQEIENGLVEEARRYHWDNKSYGEDESHTTKAAKACEEAMAAIFMIYKRDLLADVDWKKPLDPYG